jgi:hypothetical protein
METYTKAGAHHRGEIDSSSSASVSSSAAEGDQKPMAKAKPMIPPKIKVGGANASGVGGGAMKPTVSTMQKLKTKHTVLPSKPIINIKKPTAATVVDKQQTTKKVVVGGEKKEKVVGGTFKPTTQSSMVKKVVVPSSQLKK